MMKTMAGMLALVLMGVMLLGTWGCASSRYSEESYNQPQVLKDYIRNHPDYYQEFENEAGR